MSATPGKLPDCVRDRDGDVWVLVKGQHYYQCGSGPDGPGVTADLEQIEEAYGPIEMPRWVQAAHGQGEK